MATWIHRRSVVVWIPLLGLVIAGAFPSTTIAVSPGSGPSFGQIARVSRLITLADVTTASKAGAYVLHVEHVFKGQAGSRLTFGPDNKAVALLEGERVLIAQMDPRFLDFRGTTIWRVGSNGRLSDAGVVGQPLTLADFYAYLRLPGTDSSPAPLGTATRRADTWPVIVVSGFLGFGLALLWPGRLPRRRAAVAPLSWPRAQGSLSARIVRRLGTPTDDPRRAAQGSHPCSSLSTTRSGDHLPIARDPAPEGGLCGYAG